MFHFPALPHTALCIQAAATPHDGGQVSPFGNPRITAWLPAPRGISQAPASFIGSWCQGIHRVPSKTWQHTTNALHPAENRRCSRPLCSSQETDGNRRPAPHPQDSAPARRRPQTPRACSLRTQQRAHPARPPPVPVPNPRRGRTNQTGPGTRTRVNNQCSTMSKWAPGRTRAGPDARCSLERR
jgi:hypothetical protein